MFADLLAGAFFAVPVLLVGVALIWAILIVLTVAESYRDPFWATAQAWRLWPSMPWLTSRHHSVLQDDLINVAAVLGSQDIPYGMLPVIRQLPRRATKLAGKTLACHYALLPQGLIVVRHDIASLDTIGRAFVIGHEMGHAVQAHLHLMQAVCDHWLVTPMRDAEPEYFANAIGWFCAHYVLCREQGIAPLPPLLLAPLIQKMIALRDNPSPIA